LPPSYAAEWEASGRSFVLLAGLGWKILMDAYATARDQVPADRWLDVHFEDVLAQPRAAFGQMLDLMGLEEDRRFAQALSRMRFEVDRQDAFRRELGPAAVGLLERSLADHLTFWGYR
jgi:sulfotransferase family protein